MPKTSSKGYRSEFKGRNVGNDFVRELVDHILRKYHRRHEELRKELSKDIDHVYFVHELCQCRRKLLMQRLYPELDVARAYEPAIMLGELVHLGAETLTHSEKEVVKAKEVETRIGKVRVVGIIDIYYPERSVVVDVKYARRLCQEVPLEHHKLQVSLYAWLADAKYGEIWYITPEGIKPYSPVKPANESTAKHLIENPKSPMWKKWECKYCQYSKVCSVSML